MKVLTTAEHAHDTRHVLKMLLNFKNYQLCKKYDNLQHVHKPIW